MQTNAKETTRDETFLPLNNANKAAIVVWTVYPHWCRHDKFHQFRILKRVPSPLYTTKQMISYPRRPHQLSTLTSSAKKCPLMPCLWPCVVGICLVFASILGDIRKMEYTTWWLQIVLVRIVTDFIRWKRVVLLWFVAWSWDFGQSNRFSLGCWGTIVWALM